MEDKDFEWIEKMFTRLSDDRQEAGGARLARILKFNNVPGNSCDNLRPRVLNLGSKAVSRRWPQMDADKGKSRFYHPFAALSRATEDTEERLEKTFKAWDLG